MSLFTQACGRLRDSPAWAKRMSLSGSSRPALRRDRQWDAQVDDCADGLASVGGLVMNLHQPIRVQRSARAKGRRRVSST